MTSEVVNFQALAAHLAPSIWTVCPPDPVYGDVEREPAQSRPGGRVRVDVDATSRM